MKVRVCLLLISLPVLLGAALEAQSGVTVVSPTPASVVIYDEDGNQVDLPESCMQTPEEGVYQMSCFTPGSYLLKVAREGFERRIITIKIGADPVHLDLQDSRWVPSPIQFVLSPEEFERGVTVSWVEDERLVSTVPHNEHVVGPSVAPGAPYAIAVSGAAAPLLLVGDRDPKREPLSLDSQAGMSVAVLVLDPFSTAPVAGCEIEVVAFVRFSSVGLDWASPVVKGTGRCSEGGLCVATAPPTEGALRIKCPGNPAMMLEAPLAASDVILVPAEELEIELTADHDDEAVSGTIHVVRPDPGGGVEIATTLVGADGGAKLRLPAGEYRLIVDAPGFHTEDFPVRVPKRAGLVRIQLRQARTTHGRVLDHSGAPVPEAVIMALTVDMKVEGRSNLVQVEADGRFVVTLPGEDDIQLRISAPGYSQQLVTLDSSEDEEVKVVLEEQCSVTLEILTETGEAVTAPVLPVSDNTMTEVQLAHRQTNGMYLVSLHPGRWFVFWEAGAKLGSVDIGEACDGAVMQLVLKNPGQESFAMPAVP